MKQTESAFHLKLIRSGNGKFHLFNTDIMSGRSYIGTLCGKTVFHRKPPAYSVDAVRDFDADKVDCKNCRKALP